MRKRRGDSPWSKLTVEQRKQMDRWYFDENLNYPVILERAAKEFGVQASRQTLTAYFRHREDVVGGVAGWEDLDVENPRARRVGAGMEWKELEAMTLHSAAMAAYELSLAEPDKMRVTEMRSLMKMLNEHHRLLMDRAKMKQKEETDAMLMQLKAVTGLSGMQTKEEFEKQMFETADIVHRAQRKAAEERAAMKNEAKSGQNDGAAASISKDKQASASISKAIQFFTICGQIRTRRTSTDPKVAVYFAFQRVRICDTAVIGRDMFTGTIERLIMQKIIVLLVCGFVSFQVHAEPELRGSPYELEKFLSGVPKMVSIAGESETKLPADRAVVMVKISTESKWLQESLKSNQVTRTKLLGYLKSKGIPMERVQASKFSSTPKHGWFSDKAKSYRVDNFVKVTVQDENEFQAVAGAVDMWPEIQYLSIDFEHSNKDALKSQAIAKACENAGEKKKMYEEKFGVTLVARRFSEGQVEMKGPMVVKSTPPEKRGESSWSSAKTAAPTETGDASEVLEGVSPFGELSYTVRVNVEYSVEPK